MSPSFQIRPIEPSDDAAMAAIIREVMPEFGADGPGFAIHDEEVDCMAEAYARLVKIHEPEQLGDLTSER